MPIKNNLVHFLGPGGADVFLDPVVVKSVWKSYMNEGETIIKTSSDEYHRVLGHPHAVMCRLFEADQSLALLTENKQLQARVEELTKTNNRLNHSLDQKNQVCARLQEQSAKTEGKLQGQLKREMEATAYWQNSFIKSQDRVAKLFATKASAEELTRELERYKQMQKNQSEYIAKLHQQIEVLERKLKDAHNTDSETYQRLQASIDELKKHLSYFC